MRRYNHKRLSNAHIKFHEFAFELFLPLRTGFIREDRFYTEVTNILCPLIDKVLVGYSNNKCKLIVQMFCNLASSKQ
ncbi:hypothetical protein SAMN05421752_115110 [Natronorubrum thiooxidans]|uniref:Uncharacterized protein n=1 Tax=Natronorubrum thiooxidans TaxID=308853 RepID=A0A1N7GUG6_9EURY|nr:hypothetical protein SAMN05421752_115110 [Natronorubrum thiooxidans]